ncbi:hypothetical protein E2C01_017345 [Portunus trituberculatus]|uniref:Uncharacterized protein n=1 Tax=Portunus trituberculatus TaxID=210409 RepID=A0A5B7DTJ1_PORTR|nr:hypothetical protein [Portunus trituberculatus]
MLKFQFIERLSMNNIYGTHKISVLRNAESTSGAMHQCTDFKMLPHQCIPDNTTVIHPPPQETANNCLGLGQRCRSQPQSFVQGVSHGLLLCHHNLGVDPTTTTTHKKTPPQILPRPTLKPSYPVRMVATTRQIMLKQSLHDEKHLPHHGATKQ